jgi:hypothetical protein
MLRPVEGEVQKVEVGPRHQHQVVHSNVRHALCKNKINKIMEASAYFLYQGWFGI